MVLMVLLVLSRSDYFIKYEVEGVAMGFVGPDPVFADGDIVRNKDWLGLKSALNNRGLLGDF